MLTSYVSVVVVLISNETRANAHAICGPAVHSCFLVAQHIVIYRLGFPKDRSRWLPSRTGTTSPPLTQNSFRKSEVKQTQLICLEES